MIISLIISVTTIISCNIPEIEINNGETGGEATGGEADGETTGGEAGGEATGGEADGETTGGETGDGIIRIRTSSELEKIGFDSLYPLNGHYVLENDIIVNNWIPIGTNIDYYSGQSAFTGSFTGNNHSVTINSFAMDSMTGIDVGFIGYAQGAEIKNLVLMLNNSVLNLSVTGQQYVGAIVGRCYNTSFKNISINGNLKVTKNNDGYLNVGGITGYIGTLNSKEVEIIDCNTDIILNVDSTGDIYLGGLVGSGMNINSQIKIRNSIINNDLIVKGSNVTVGGIIGQVSNITLLTDFLIEDNTFIGNISSVSTSIYIGGVLGLASKVSIKNFNYSKILTCISNSGDFGGIAGRINDSNIEYCSVNTNINFGNNNNLSCGGIVGTSNQSFIKDCYIVGDIFSDQLSYSFSSLGGIVGYNTGTVDTCYHNGDINFSSGSLGGIAGSNNGIIKNSYHQGDFISKDHIGNSVGGVSGSNGGEILYSYCQGNMELTSVRSIGGVSSNNSGQIKNSYHIGIIDIINNEAINAGGITGTNSGTISESYHDGKINVITNYVTGNNALSMIGGISGYNLSGAINNSYSSTEIHAISTGIYNSLQIGGIVGGVINQSNKSIFNCYHQGKLEAESSGNSYVGGIIGSGNATIIENNYHYGSLKANSNGTSYIGGISGQITNNSDLINCISFINDNDTWDLETFTTLGWDFLNTWKIDSKNLLPIFKWQN
jgi:hypothetical protein